MKKIRLSININKARSHPRVEHWIQLFIKQTKPVVDYYNRLNEREKQILFFGGIFAIIMAFYLIISAALDFERSLQNDYDVIQTYRADAEYLAREYKDINHLTPNEFSDVAIERIKGDLAQVVSGTPDIQQVDNILTIKVDKVKFSDIMNILNQFRKSYGIFPTKVKITRLSESGYVSLNASFKVNIQHE